MMDKILISLQSSFYLYTCLSIILLYVFNTNFFYSIFFIFFFNFLLFVFLTFNVYQYSNYTYISPKKRLASQ